VPTSEITWSCLSSSIISSFITWSWQLQSLGLRTSLVWMRPMNGLYRVSQYVVIAYRSYIPTWFLIPSLATLFLCPVQCSSPSFFGPSWLFYFHFNPFLRSFSFMHSRSFIRVHDLSFHSLRDAWLYDLTWPVSLLLRYLIKSRSFIHQAIIIFIHSSHSLLHSCSIRLFPSNFDFKFFHGPISPVEALFPPFHDISSFIASSVSQTVLRVLLCNTSIFFVF